MLHSGINYDGCNFIKQLNNERPKIQFSDGNFLNEIFDCHRSVASLFNSNFSQTANSKIQSKNFSNFQFLNWN